MQVDDLALLGGRISLNFANTLDPRFGVNACDLIRDCDDILRWGVHASLLERGDEVRVSAALSAAERSALLDEALAIREAIFSVFNGDRSHESTEVLRAAYIDALSRATLAPQLPAWQLTTGPRRVVDAVVLDAIELLFSPQATRVKLCAATEGCGWLFLDTTRNATRRWCSMRYCGSRAKARRAAGRRRLDACA